MTAIPKFFVFHIASSSQSHQLFKAIIQNDSAKCWRVFVSFSWHSMNSHHHEIMLTRRCERFKDECHCSLNSTSWSQLPFEIMMLKHETDEKFNEQADAKINYDLIIKIYLLLHNELNFPRNFHSSFFLNLSNKKISLISIWLNECKV